MGYKCYVLVILIYRCVLQERLHVSSQEIVVCEEWSYGNVDIQIARPAEKSTVQRPLGVELSVVFEDGAEAMRAIASERYRLCYGAAGQSGCMALGAESYGTALELPLMRLRLYAWLERPECLWRKIFSSTDLEYQDIEHRSIQILKPESQTRTQGEYLSLEALFFLEESTHSNNLTACLAALDQRRCQPISKGAKSLRMKHDFILPAWSEHQAYAWIEMNDTVIARESVEFSTVSDETQTDFNVKKYSHPRPQYAWLALHENFTIRVPPKCQHRAAVCILERNASCGTACEYFQHAAPYLTSCWSFFRAFAHLSPVLVLRDGLHLGYHKWTKAVLDAMGVTVIQHTIPHCAVTARLNNGSLSWDQDTPGTVRDLGWTPLSWLATAADATALQAKILDSSQKTSSNKPRLGVLNRRHTGRFPPNIVQQVRAASGIEFTGEAYFEDFSVHEQARWIHDQDIIISPHGAQLTNLLWAKPCTVVLEVFPKYYYVPGYFSALALNVGAVSYIAYPGSNPERDVSRALDEGPHFVTHFRRNHIPQKRLPNETIPTLMKAHKECLAKKQNAFFFDERRKLYSPPKNRFQSISSITFSSAESAEELIATVLLVEDRDYSGDDDWFLCAGALGDRFCTFIQEPGHISLIISIPDWTQTLTYLRLWFWLEVSSCRWIQPTFIDIQRAALLDSNHLMEVAINHPQSNAKVTSPVHVGLSIEGKSEHQPINVRGFWLCYAAVDIRSCQPVWSDPRPVSVLERTSSATTPIELPPGNHQLLVWIAADGRPPLATTSVNFTVVADREEQENDEEVRSVGVSSESYF